MAKKKKKIIILTIFIILILNAVCSTDFMLRAAVFRFSPKSAITMEYKKSDNNYDEEDLYIITKNAPVEEATQGELTTWVVYHFGPLKFASYYGEC